MIAISTLLRTKLGMRKCGVQEEVVERPLPDFSIISRDGLGEMRDSLDVFVPDYAPLNQLGTASCLPHAWCVGEVVSLAAQGLPAEMPSIMAAYYWGRFWGGERITDDGCRPSDVMGAVAHFGLPTEAQFPFDPARINARPPMSARWDARGHAGQRESFQIYERSLEGRKRSVGAALSRGMPLILSIPTTAEFDRYRGGGTLPYPLGPIKGWHAVLVIGMGDDGSLLILNSYGDWGTRGRGLLSNEYLRLSPSIIVMRIRRSAA